MATANAERGEFDIVLAGRNYPMRPSWEAIQAFESRPIADERGRIVAGGTGKSLLQLAGEANRNALACGDCAIVVTECIRAWGRANGDKHAERFHVEKVGPLLMEIDGGIMIVQKQLGLMLYLAVTGGLTASGEIKAPAAEKTGETMADAGASKVSPAPPSDGRRRSSGKPRR